MKRYDCLACAWKLLLGLAVGLDLAFTACEAAETRMEWPRVIFRDGATNTIYQPQLESWDYVTLKATAAVAVQPKGAGTPVFGTIQITAKTRVDRAERSVLLNMTT